jgi:hypothetical protein
VSIEGAEELVAKLDKIEGDIRPELERTTDRAVKYVYSKVPSYPPPPPDSDYRRTGTLGRSITTDVRSVGSSVAGVIGTDIVYAPYVISETDQAWMHRGRWWTLQEHVRGLRDIIVGYYEEMLRKLVR